jgi:hypothetical protein
MPKERRALRIKSARQKIECDAAAVCAQRFGVAQTRERMVIGDKIKRFALGLQRDGRPHHAKIITNVQGTAGLEAGQNAHDVISDLRFQIFD